MLLCIFTAACSGPTLQVYNIRIGEGGLYKRWNCNQSQCVITCCRFKQVLFQRNPNCSHAHHTQEQRHANIRAARFDRRCQKMTLCFFKTAGVGCFNLKTSCVISAGSFLFGAEAECGALMPPLELSKRGRPRFEEEKKSHRRCARLARGTDSLLTCVTGKADEKRSEECFPPRVWACRTFEQTARIHRESYETAI